MKTLLISVLIYATFYRNKPKIHGILNLEFLSIEVLTKEFFPWKMI